MDDNKFVDLNTKIYSIINDDKKGFWYNLGASVGGPLYTGLYNFVLQHSYGKKVFFLSRDGYNLYNIFKNSGHENIEYLYTSRRSLLLACITEMNSEDIATLPPYTTGQTVGEIIDYLCVDREKIKHLHQAGFDNVIACLGTALTSEMAHLLSRYCDEVILSYDADEAGQKATARAIGIFNSIGMKLKVVHLSGGKDPDEILRNYGPERYRSLIEGAANDIEFALVRLKSEYDIATSDGKMKFLEKAAEVLASTRSQIACDIYASRLSEELGVAKQSILIRIEQLSRRNVRQNEKKQFRDIQHNSMSANTKAALANDTDIKSIKAEQMLIAALMRSPELYRKMENDLTEEDFSVAVYRKIFSVIRDKINESRSLDITFFSQELTAEEMSELVGIVKKHESLSVSIKACADCLRAMRESKEKKSQKLAFSDMSDEDFLNLFKGNK